MKTPEGAYGYEALKAREQELLQKISRLEAQGKQTKELAKLHEDHTKLMAELEGYSQAA